MAVDRTRKRKTLTSDLWESVGAFYTPDGKEIVFGSQMSEGCHTPIPDSARACSGWQGIRHRAHRYAHIPAFLPDVDRRRGNSHRRPAEAHAAFGHPHTMNIYGDAASVDMREALRKIVQLALKGN